ncbi:hypothetical protein [Pasteurella testudinis]|nr:hypothetical protein [Pasteurella testudinis]
MKAVVIKQACTADTLNPLEMATPTVKCGLAIRLRPHLHCNS